LKRIREREGENDEIITNDWILNKLQSVALKVMRNNLVIIAGL
jgi:hypothetical protein